MIEKKLLDTIAIYRDKIRDSKLNGKFLTTDNVFLCINLFENIIENFGYFKEIMTEIKVDLTELIFSHNLTADERTECSLIQRVPYFLLYLQSEEKQKHMSEDCRDTVDNLSEKITRINAALLGANEMNEMKENECQRLQSEILRYENILDELKIENESVKESIQESSREMHDVMDQLARDNDNLKLSLQKQKDTIKSLQVYKDGHDHMDSTFMDACQQYKHDPTEHKVDPFNKKNNLESEIKAIVLMQQDLITLENRLLDDFDRRLTDFKCLMLDYENVEEQSSVTSDNDEGQPVDNMGRMMMEFNKAKIHFKNECMQLELESLMLENHQIVLVNELTVIHQAELDTDPKSKSDHKDIRDSFIIDQKLMSKYSAIVYISSNGGETYYETKETLFCESCAGKVVFCPHNLTKNKVIKLPLGSTHIKIQRPEIKVNSTFARYMAPKSEFINEEKMDTAKYNDDRRTISSRKSQRSSMTSNDSEMALPFEVLLEDYENRTKITRTAPRLFDESKILSIFEDFWATILIEDEFEVQVSEISTPYDKLYIFFLDRYANERAAMLSLYDFLISIIDVAGYSQLMQLFCHILLVNVDSSVMRYLFHILDCVDIVHWSGENDLRIFIEVVYPFLNEEEVDSLVLSYISYSEHIYNKSNVFEFILYNILKQREPRFIKIKGEASEFKTIVTGYYTFKEFQILLESLTSLPNKKLSIRLFKELALLYADDGDKEIAPISKIAHIVSFLSFLEEADNMKHILDEQYRSSATLKVQPIRWGFRRLKALSKQLQKDE